MEVRIQSFLFAFLLLTIAVGCSPYISYVTYDDKVAYSTKDRNASLKEKKLWKKVTDKNTLAGYLSYLKQYPQGEFAKEAEEIIRFVEYTFFIEIKMDAQPAIIRNIPLKIWQDLISPELAKSDIDFLNTDLEVFYKNLPNSYTITTCQEEPALHTDPRPNDSTNPIVKPPQITEEMGQATFTNEKKKSTSSQSNAYTYQEISCDAGLQSPGFLAFEPFKDTMNVGESYAFRITVDDQLYIDTLLATARLLFQKEIPKERFKNRFRDTIDNVIFQKINVGTQIEIYLLYDTADFKVVSYSESIQDICQPISPRWDWDITPKAPGGVKQLGFVVYSIDSTGTQGPSPIFRPYKELVHIVVRNQKEATTNRLPHPHVWVLSIIAITLLSFIVFKLKKSAPNEQVNNKLNLQEAIIPPITPIPKDIKKKKVFLSYSHKDESWKEKLDNHLSALKLTDMIETWNDRKIPIGEAWNEIIVKELLNADIILMLISPDFLASDYIFEKEVPKAIERHEKGLAKVVPVYIRDCDFGGLPFERLEGFPKNGMAVASHETHLQDAAMKEIALGIRTIVERS